MRYKISLLFLIMVGIVSVPNFSYGAIPASERAALVAFYKSTNGDIWATSTGWKTPPLAADGFALPGTEANWFGVKISGNTVIAIDLTNNEMYGSLPAQIGNLSNLQELCLEENELSGDLPPAFGNLSHLESLNLKNNNFSGSIPSQLGNPSNLEYLNLSYNRLSGAIPPGLGNLSNLNELWLSGNQLSGAIPSELGNISSLYWLWMNNNQLNGKIPLSLTKLTHMQGLDIGYNCLYTNSHTLRTWLNSKDPDWEAHQDQCTTQAIISLSQSSLYFAVTAGGPMTGAQNVLIKNTNGGTLRWTAASNTTWLNISPNSGSGSGEITISATPAGLSEGIYIDTITVSAPNAENSPQTIAVTLKIFAAGSSVAPFGDFATPVDGSTVSGSIAVTGWALDDIEVKKVEIFNGEAYIGDAIFVEGARPDVENAYPQYPLNYKAGWGYMLLTNFLPDGGNGTFTLSARATDAEGNQVTLGSKTITCNNSQAVKPFGTLDTPIQGGIASGYNFLNWGWVLTPQPNDIPNDGSTIEIWLDGVEIGRATYNMYREDIASLFPGYANSNGAVGYFKLDTTNYEDGIHTITWTAADSAGNADGIGSRYFYILNTVSSAAALTSSNGPNIPFTFKDLAYLPGPYNGSLKMTKGYGKDREACRSELIPDQNGIYKVTIKEMERIEMHLGENLSAVRGYMIVGNQLRPLPIGSTLDKRAGVYYWSPGPGFYGTYDIVFLIKDTEDQWYQEKVEITIEPRFRSNE